MEIAWVFAALIFLCFAVLFWTFGNQPLRAFSIRQRFEEDEASEEMKKFRDGFLQEFDGYLSSINSRNKFRYRIAAGGFLVAFLTALLLSITL